MSNDINLTDGAVTEVLNDKVDIDFGNVPSNSVGFARCSTEVTNCITEIPQRIKYTLEDGTLTVKAGTVAIFPYGTEDKTGQLPIGSTFLNENYKVVDTCWDDNKFFVWAELQTGFPRKSTYNALDIIYLDRNGSNLRTPTNTACSGSTADTTLGTYILWYDTTNNYVKFSVDNGVTWNTNNSLPLVIAQGNSTVGYTSIQHTFNGMGYMGSTIWVDKGVKGLIPNGRNEDGTLRNIEFATNKLYLSANTMPASYNRNDIIYNIVQDKVFYSAQTYNVSKDGYIYNNQKQLVPICTLSKYSTDSTGKITSFKPKQVFRALDYNDKPEIISWGIVDLPKQANPFNNNKIDWNTVFQLPCDALVAIGGSANNNNITLMYSYDSNVDNSYNTYKTSLFGYFALEYTATTVGVLPKGIYIKATGGSANQHLSYIPLKGVEQ